MAKCPVCGYEQEAKNKRFSPPKIEDVIVYCFERKNNVSPQKFLDHYESNGWMVGKTPMKSWQAAVRTWEGNDYGLQNGGVRGRVESARDKRVREADEEVRNRLGILQRSAGPSPAIHQSRNERGRSGEVGETIIDNPDMEIETLR